MEQGRKKNQCRSCEDKKRYKHRISRMTGQLNGISKMIEEDRYCGDILIQISAVSSALISLRNKVLEDHIRSCVIEEVQKGNTEIVDELMEFLAKMR